MQLLPGIAAGCLVTGETTTFQTKDERQLQHASAEGVGCVDLAARQKRRLAGRRKMNRNQDKSVESCVPGTFHSVQRGFVRRAPTQAGAGRGRGGPGAQGLRQGDRAAAGGLRVPGTAEEQRETSV